LQNFGCVKRTLNKILYKIKYLNRDKDVRLFVYEYEGTNVYLNETLPSSVLDKTDGEARQCEEEGSIVNSLRGEVVANTALLIN
jgi:hypothetical protein